MPRNPAHPYDVAGRTAFITGAARGIGAETARRLHSKGANVALVGLEPERLRALAAELGEERAAAFEADVTDFEALTRAVAECKQRFGGIDVGIANAGIAFTGPLATTPIEHVERTLAVNFLGVWRTDRALIGEIMQRKGYLLNIASLAAVSRAPLMGPYAAAKAGVEALTDSLRIETLPSGARVGCAYFGFIDTDLVRRAFASESVSAARRALPAWLTRPIEVGRAGEAIARGVERRSAHITAPGWVAPAMVLRGVIAGLDGLMGRDRRLREAIRMAESAQPPQRVGRP